VADFSQRHFIKICGVTNIHDAKVVISSGATALGLILAKSSRRVSREVAQSIAEETRGEILRTLVFRENSDAYIVQCADQIGPDVIQVHGPLSDDLAGSLRERGLLIVKALTIGGAEFLSFDDDRVDAVLIDGPTPGSGVAHSWVALGERHFHRPVIVAGGLDPDNVAATIQLTHPWGVDCASGVESSAGIKDPTLVTRFVENARHSLEQREE
jgi:phosphoribosylanthranilate isomerase